MMQPAQDGLTGLDGVGGLDGGLGLDDLMGDDIKVDRCTFPTRCPPLACLSLRLRLRLHASAVHIVLLLVICPPSTGGGCVSLCAFQGKKFGGVGGVGAEERGVDVLNSGPVFVQGLAAGRRRPCGG